MEMLGRYEDAHLMRMMKVANYSDTRLYEMDGYGNTTCSGLPLIAKRSGAHRGN